MKEQYKKLSIDFPIEEYTYLKMTCAKKGVSIKNFVTNAIIRLVEENEDEIDAKELGLARREIAESGVLTWEELEKKLGWDKI
jgi:hypothetical protein